MELSIFIVILLIIIIILFVKLQKEIRLRKDSLEYTKLIENKLIKIDKKNKRLSKENNDFNISQEVANIGTWEIAGIKSIPFWSNQVYKIFGKDRNIFTPEYRDVIRLFHDSDRRIMNKEFFDSIKNKTEFSATGKIYHENGFVYHVEIKGRHIYDKKGTRIRSIGSLVDVTDKIKLSNVLKQMNKNLDERVDQEIQKNKLQQEELFRRSRMAQMGEMLSMIAHQWRQPLGAISSISIDLNMKLELESFNLKEEESRQECQTYFDSSLRDINNLIDGLSNTIDDFRNFYKPDKKTKLCLIDEPVEKALKIIQASLDSNGISVIKEFDSMKKIKLFDGEVIQVILNILQNAQDNFLDNSISDAKILINTYDNDKNSVIEIQDNGGGIDKKVIDSIFDPYYSTKNEKNGTGLGLYMSKIIINEHHNGIINVKNVNNGVCFKISLAQKEEE